MISHPFRHALVVCLLLGAAFFLVPVSASDQRPVLRGAVTALGLAGAVWLVLRQVRRQVGDPVLPLSRQLTALVAGVLVFALADYAMAVHVPGEFDGLRTRIDALYFALTTLATVGYGDVHAEGQVARTLICLQLLFNLVVFGTGASLLTSRLRARTHVDGS